ncbi:uncharacterized protein TNCV_612641 [Trichonephila clavipes]|nr:uncharacterized protein TNCV_612641 [Trichonephila clavipes]
MGESERLKRKVELNGSGDRKDLKRSKICRKRSLRGSEHRDQKRPTPEPKQGIKRAIPSLFSSRNHKYRRPNNPSQGSQPIAGPSHRQDSRQGKTPTVASRHEESGQYNKARETKTTKKSKTTRRISRGAEEQWNGKYSTEQHQEKEPQYGSLRRRSSG